MGIEEGYGFYIIDFPRRYEVMKKLQTKDENII